MANSVSNLVAAISNKFGFTVTSESTTPINLAVIPAYYDTLGLASGALHYHNVAALNNAGAQVQAVIDEGTWPLPDDSNITIHSTDTTKPVRDLLAYLKHYPQYLGKMIIHSANQQAYNNALKVSYANPFNDAERKPIDLNQYFDVDQFQDGKIVLDFSGVDFPVTPDLLMTMVIPAQSTVTVDLFFR
jgi:hypothetical protein